MRDVPLKDFPFDDLGAHLIVHAGVKLIPEAPVWPVLGFSKILITT
jgi:hypothetical protein